MGLDIDITTDSRHRTDKKGRAVWTTTKVARLDNTWAYFDQFEIDNCATMNFTGEELWRKLQNIAEINPKEHDEIMTEFIAAKIKNTDDKVYSVHVWY